MSFSEVVVQTVKLLDLNAHRGETTAQPGLIVD